LLLKEGGKKGGREGGKEVGTFDCCSPRSVVGGARLPPAAAAATKEVRERNDG
jgi:hypothetical protein